MSNPFSPADPSTVNGYELDATSLMWKSLCQGLPCDQAMGWPDYATTEIDVVIDGENAVIQCWKGWCEDLMPKLPPLPPPYGDIEFPGGFGAEVGVYRRPTGQQKPKIVVPAFPPAWPLPYQIAARAWFEARVMHINLSGVTDYWLPAPDLVSDTADVSFTLVDPVFGDSLIEYNTGTYWTCQWMRPTSFTRWCLDWSIRHKPFPPTDLVKLANVSKYILNFTVAGAAYVWDDAGMRPAS